MLDSLLAKSGACTNVSSIYKTLHIRTSGNVSTFKYFKYLIHFHFSSSIGKKGSGSVMKSYLINDSYISSVSLPTNGMISIEVEAGRGALTKLEA